MTAPDEREPAVQQAERLGHTVQRDDVWGRVERRWTCARCEAHVYDDDGKIHGRASLFRCGATDTGAPPPDDGPLGTILANGPWSTP